MPGYGKRRFRVLLTAALLGLAVSLFGCPLSKEEAPDDLAEARTAMMKRDFLEAEKFFERYLKRTPEGGERWEVWNSLVELALSVRNDRKAAIELLEAMRIEYEDSTAKKREISVRLAELYRLSRKYDRAVFLWSSVAEDKNATHVERARACKNLASVYLRRLEFELAKESLGYCLELEVPDAIRAECLYDLAQTYMGMDEVDNAISRFRDVLALKNIAESTRTLSIFMLADALEQKGEDAEAMELFNSIGNTYPNRKVVEQRIDFLEKKKKNSSPRNGTNNR